MYKLVTNQNIVNKKVTTQLAAAIVVVVAILRESKIHCSFEMLCCEHNATRNFAEFPRMSYLYFITAVFA